MEKYNIDEIIKMIKEKSDLIEPIDKNNFKIKDDIYSITLITIDYYRKYIVINDTIIKYDEEILNSWNDIYNMWNYARLSKSKPVQREISSILGSFEKITIDMESDLDFDYLVIDDKHRIKLIRKHSKRLYSDPHYFIWMKFINSVHYIIQ